MHKRYHSHPHHRRPLSLGGLDEPFNISFVHPKEHKYFHFLFGNMNAYQTCNRINQLQLVRPLDIKVVCEFINGHPVTRQGGNNSKKKGLVLYSLEYLSNGRTFNEFIEYINRVYLDPSYIFNLKKIF